MGYASVTDAPYQMRDFLGEYEEVIRSGAFTKTLAEKDDVRLLLNHDGLPLARTKSGTLTLTEVMSGKDDPQGRGQTGLWVEADMDPRSSLATDVKLAMERGDLDEMSFAFQVIRQEWSRTTPSATSPRSSSSTSRWSPTPPTPPPPWAFAPRTWTASTTTRHASCSAA
jgi:HK97 family phage prohead protease